MKDSNGTRLTKILEVYRLRNPLDDISDRKCNSNSRKSVADGQNPRKCVARANDQRRRERNVVMGGPSKTSVATWKWILPLRSRDVHRYLKMRCTTERLYSFPPALVPPSSVFLFLSFLST